MKWNMKHSIVAKFKTKKRLISIVMTKFNLILQKAHSKVQDWLILSKKNWTKMQSAKVQNAKKEQWQVFLKP
jgi:hypothetical protein